MHPLSTALFVLGYALALPVIARLGQVKATRNRLAVVGHQFGMTCALIGWALGGRLLMVALHLAWMIGVRIWFGGPRSQPRGKAPGRGSVV